MIWARKVHLFAEKSNTNDQKCFINYSDNVVAPFRRMESGQCCLAMHARGVVKQMLRPLDASEGIDN